MVAYRKYVPFLTSFFSIRRNLLCFFHFNLESTPHFLANLARFRRKGVRFLSPAALYSHPRCVVSCQSSLRCSRSSSALPSPSRRRGKGHSAPQFLLCRHPLVVRAEVKITAFTPKSLNKRKIVIFRKKVKSLHTKCLFSTDYARVAKR